ncbi:hypothetical protein [Mucilaginibacter sp. SJ]|uniref:hypothetical protein n=1 Tax=Mucilaginibacter sp. SJ TaxID=3029053 RepID=UPI0023A98BB9|nr:hypothetical protein [Mucilaginibacter sp. SJ]WEA00654.1 hypothetical protein MusilaSJ_24675 [Mucilaginibacter sp. SJ]
MKKTLFILFTFLVLSKITYAQNTFSSSGNVGIGTTTPATAFDVKGAISVKGMNVDDTQTISVSADGTYVIASGNRIKGTYTLSFEAPNRVQTVVLLANATHYDYISSLSILQSQKN